MSANGRLPASTARIAIAALVLVGAVLCYLIVAPFIPALIWSFTLTVLFAPVEAMLRPRLHSAALSVSVTMLLAAVLVVAPVIFVTAGLIGSIVEGADVASALLPASDGAELSRNYPALAAELEWIGQYLDVPQYFQSLRARLEDWGTIVILGSITGIINLFLTFYFLFYMLRDRVRIVDVLGRLMPLSDAEFQTLADRFEKTIFASVFGTAVVSAVQGFLGGLVFWWLGLPSPIFWGVIMGLLGIVPFLGAFIIWVPVSIYLALNGQWMEAAILAAWGTLVVGLIDNIIYPILVGRQIALHSLISFIAIVGGIIVFGAYGFVLGPLIVAGSHSLLDILRSRVGNGELVEDRAE